MTRRLRYLLCGVGLTALASGGAYLAFLQPSAQQQVLAEETAKAAPGKTEVTTFGGSPARNMVNLVDKGIPEKIDPEKPLWKVQLGSRAYGGPIIAGGKIFVGTNNENPRNKRDRGKATEDNPAGPPADKGVLMCFKESTGEFLWQAIHDKLESGQVNDWPREGICSSPTVEGNRVYYVSNRCEVICADVEGMANGNDGIQTEKYKDKTDVDIVWSYDMMRAQNVFPHNMSACSPLIVGDILFIVTANGVDENHINIPSPEAPSFIALNKKTGTLLWKSNLPGKAIMHGQWANCAYGVIKGKGQVIFPGGDGWIYSFEPETGKLIWKFDANPKDSKYELGGKGTKSDFIGTPVIYNDRVYIGTGQDPEHSDGIGHFWCIDPTKTGDVSPDLVTDDKVDPPATKPNPNSAVVWHHGGNEKRAFAKRDYVFGRTMSSACIIDDLLYISDLAGYFQCLDLKTGKKYWQYDLKSQIWGSAYYVDGKVIIANEDGDLFVFRHIKEQVVMDEVEEGSKAGIAAQAAALGTATDEDTKLKARKAGEKAASVKAKEVLKAVEQKFLIDKVAMDAPVRSTAVVAAGVLYVMSEQTLYAFKKDAK